MLRSPWHLLCLPARRTLPAGRARLGAWITSACACRTASFQWIVQATRPGRRVDIVLPSTHLHHAENIVLSDSQMHPVASAAALVGEKQHHCHRRQRQRVAETTAARSAQSAVRRPVMWSETVGLRTRPRYQAKENRSWSWSCRSGVVL